MKAVIQKVSKAETIIDGKLVSSINNGIVIFLGIAIDDTDNDINWLINKIIKLRMFNTFDNNINEVKGEVLLVSQFTLQANVLKGNRPSFIKAAKSDSAKIMYEKFLKQLNENLNTELKSGVFGADMLINLSNDGPVTIIYDSSLKLKK
ncbi:MAG: D-tyrosyl-tRNA(Tyr) deacylase [Flavobacteriales bacterium]|jgi:D-tyrosyl-tRNA(Tyr) deacylase|nr:MAG: D-tyrosyl-tRNA(Tyr) deacylase [Flavobacteriales bacterium]|tara:strand:+ start:227 stop:673 length:447 start_codon:yes stop_codon:yes gene_type:complete